MITSVDEFDARWHGHAHHSILFEAGLVCLGEVEDLLLGAQLWGGE